MNHGAMNSAIRMTNPSTRYMVLRMTESERCPSCSRPVSRYPVRMVTNAIEPAPPTRKYEIMSGNWNAPLRASAVMPRPKSQRMYFTLTRPMMRDRNVDTISTTVAVNAVWAWDGRSAPSARAHRDCGVRNGSVDGELFTCFDFTENSDQWTVMRDQ